jgi:GDPmannose 4,6-dehydratase
LNLLSPWAITATDGPPGAHLAEFLLSKGYIVHSVKRRSSSFNTDRIDHLVHDPHEQGVSFYLHYGDVTDATNLIRIIQETQPDDIYNLAAQSHVQVSFEAAEYTANADGLGTLRLLEAIRILGRERDTRLLSGFHLRAGRKGAGDPAKGDHAVLSALSLRGAKLYAHWITVNSARRPWHARLERHLVQSREPDPG